jgi:hypothetical protein
MKGAKRFFPILAMVSRSCCKLKRNAKFEMRNSKCENGFRNSTFAGFPNSHFEFRISNFLISSRTFTSLYS